MSTPSIFDSSKLLTGKEIKDWIWRNRTSVNKYGGDAKNMMKFMNLDDDKLYRFISKYEVVEGEEYEQSADCN